MPDHRRKKRRHFKTATNFDPKIFLQIKTGMPRKHKNTNFDISLQCLFIWSVRFVFIHTSYFILPQATIIFNTEINATKINATDVMSFMKWSYSKPMLIFSMFYLRQLTSCPVVVLSMDKSNHVSPLRSGIN